MSTNLLSLPQIFNFLPLILPPYPPDNKCKVFARISICKKCKNFIKFAKYLQRTFFLTSGVNTHLERLGGK